MKITDVEFVKSVAGLDQLPRDGLGELAFAGRSNVGKSSLINCLLNRKKMAKTSSTPGKTRHLNYFRINDKYYFVDLPGYGYARVPRAEKEQWQRLIERYLSSSANLRGVISIIDVRRGATSLDLQLLEWLRELGMRVCLVATKADKLSRAALGRQMKELEKGLRHLSSNEIIPFSAVSGTGKKELLREILNIRG